MSPELVISLIEVGLKRHRGQLAGSLANPLALSLASGRWVMKIAFRLLLTLLSLAITSPAQEQNPCVPILLSPGSGDALDNGLVGKSREHIWEFAWTECPGASEYHLYVIGARATHPVIDDDNIRINSYRRISDDGYVADPNLRGWKWKVRAKINGEWGEWSRVGTFDVKPVGSGSDSGGEPSGNEELSAPRHIDLSLAKVERESFNGGSFTRYHLTITNRGDFPEYLFEPAPDLPPCGLNKNSSRTWLEIYSENGRRIYGYCAIRSAAELERFSFGVANGQPTPGKVYVTLIDRRLKKRYKSNRVSTKTDISPRVLAATSDRYLLRRLDYDSKSSTLRQAAGECGQ